MYRKTGSALSAVFQKNILKKPVKTDNLSNQQEENMDFFNTDSTKNFNDAVNQARNMAMTGQTPEQIFAQTGIDPVQQSIFVDPFSGKSNFGEK